MDVAKKVYRADRDKARRTAREVDGHDLSDDVANLGDEARTRVANAGDDLRRGAQDAQREVERHQPR